MQILLGAQNLHLRAFHNKKREFLYLAANTLIHRLKQNTFNHKSIKSILFIRNNDKLGDMIVSTISFREAKKAGFEVNVIAGKNNAQILKCNSNIDHLFICNGGIISTIKLAMNLRRRKIDLIVDFLDWEPLWKKIALINLISPKYTLGFNNRFYDYSINEDLSKNDHASTRNFSFLTAIGVDCSRTDDRYDLQISREVEQCALDFLTTLPYNKTLLINPFGRGGDRRMSRNQLLSVYEFIKSMTHGVNIVINTEPMEFIECDDQVFRSPFSDFSEAIALVKHVNFILSPDTSIIHVASAFRKPIVILYQKDRSDINKNSCVWGANNDEAIPIFSDSYNIQSIGSNTIVMALNSMINKSIED